MMPRKVGFLIFMLIQGTSSCAQLLEERAQMQGLLFLRTSDGKNCNLSLQCAKLSSWIQERVLMGQGVKPQIPLHISLTFLELTKLEKLLKAYIGKERDRFIFECLGNYTFSELADLFVTCTELAIPDLFGLVIDHFTQKLSNFLFEDLPKCSSYLELRSHYEKKLIEVRAILDKSKLINEFFKQCRDLAFMREGLLLTKEQQKELKAHIFHTLPVVGDSRLNFGPCGCIVLTENNEKKSTVTLINEVNFERIATVEFPEPVLTVLFAANPHLLVHTGSCIYQLDVLTMKSKKVLTSIELGSQGEFKSLCYVPCSSLFACSIGSDLVFFDMAKQAHQTAVSNESDAGNSAALLSTRDGSIIADVRDNGVIRFWSTHSKKLISTNKIHKSPLVYWEMNTNILFTQSADGLFCCWLNGKCIVEEKIDGKILCSCWPQFVLALEDGGIALYRQKTGEKKILFLQHSFVAGSFHTGGILRLQPKKGKYFSMT